MEQENTNLSMEPSPSAPPSPGLASQNPFQNYSVPLSIIVAGALVAGAVIYSSANGPRSQNGNPAAAGGIGAQAAAGRGASKDIPPVTDKDHILGNPDALVALVEYADYQCPFCGRFFTDVESKLKEEYIKSGKVKMIYRQLQFLGAESTNAAAAAECADDQGKYWGYHDALYKVEIADGQENNGNLNRGLFIKLARETGVDLGAFTSCLDSNTYGEKIKKDTSDTQALGISGTPTSYINGQQIVGAQPYATFKSAIEAALQKGK